MPPTMPPTSPPTRTPSPTSALLLIDIQNDFLPPSGSLAVPKGDEVVRIIYRVLGAGWLGEEVGEGEGEGQVGEVGEVGEVWDLVVASQDWHPTTHISFSSHHKHPHAAQPYTTVKVPRGVLGEHYEIHKAGGVGGVEGDEEVEGGGGDDDDKTLDEPLDDTLDDPMKGYKSQQGVDDGQVDLNLWPDHCVQNTYGAELAKDLKIALRPWWKAGKFALVRKGTNLRQEAFSAFSGSVIPPTSPEIPSALGLHDQEHDPDPLARAGAGGQGSDDGEGEDLADLLIRLGVTKVCVVGLAMDYCVAQTALAALNKESNPFSVYIYTPAVKGVGEETTKTALRVCREKGIGLLNTEDEMREVFGKKRST